ncbi:mRNA-binding protein PUF3, partial [Lecanoromycetidae sp. Uapishka_2]
MPAQQQRSTEQLSQTQLNQLLGEFGNLNVGRENQNSNTTYREAPYTTSSGFGNGYSQDLMANGGEVWNREENGYQAQQAQFSPTVSAAGSLISSQTSHRPMPFASQYATSSNNSEARASRHSPYNSSSGTPPTYQQRGSSRSGNNAGVPPTQAALLDYRLRGLQQEQQAYMMPPNHPRYRNQYHQQNPYDFQPQRNVHPNQINQYYQMPPNPSLLTGPQIPRGPPRDHDLAQPVRSPLLEEFRNNSKTNKRYELKDIYDHIVEFSGDQHGSRFIQQKLETANSDEKDQVYRELFPNAIQLMTDVFGNYVIQKFFEHGNQSQKKALAHQMKNHILSLSKQMYGCRALEHILTDQQAQLIKELENDVINCVKDQNGNHVVQKAIERVPAQHIQFIINAFTGQVQILATHSYGCRVVQRMLEHCEEPTRSNILAELHACAASLIVDQFGNYVTQHVIEHGADEDRGRLVSLVTSQLSSFSKHKFASNVVEKSIEFGSKEERQRIVATVTAINDKGESPSLSLIRDQYGNYVIQKLLNTLKGFERENFVDLIKDQIALLKRFSYGKQIAAIEKLIYTSPPPFPQHPMRHGSLQLPDIDTSAAPTPPLSTGAAQSPQSSLPSTHANSIDEPTDGSRKSSGSNAVGVLTPTSTRS